MQSGIKRKYWVGLLWAAGLLCPAVGLAAESEQPADAPATTASAPVADSRPALFPGTESLAAGADTADSRLPQLDKTQWLNESAKTGRLLVRAAFGPKAAGVALILTADPGAQSAGSFAGQLRTSLPVANWHTYLQSMPLPPRSDAKDPAMDDWRQTVGERAAAALALIEQAHAQLPRVVLGEGRVGIPLAELDELGADGLVLLNLPVPHGLSGLAQAAQPTLVLQVLPYRVPQGFPLAASVATRQLPRLSPRQPKSLLLRQVRGWLRQYEKTPQPSQPGVLETASGTAVLPAGQAGPG